MEGQKMSFLQQLTWLSMTAMFALFLFTVSAKGLAIYSTGDYFNYSIHSLMQVQIT